jgi:membrane dipeptidase
MPPFHSPRALGAALVLGAVFALGACATPPMSEAQLQEKARGIHERVFTIDSHVDLPRGFPTGPFDPGNRTPAQFDLVKAKEGGQDAVFWIVYAAQTEVTPENMAAAKTKALADFAAIRSIAEKYPERAVLATSAAEARAAAKSGKLVIFIGIENGYAFGTDLELLAQMHALGARYVTLTHNGHNPIGGSNVARAEIGDDPGEDRGLTAFGRRAIAEMNRLGIMIDVSHTNARTTMEAVALSRAPVIASHSNAKALCDHPRNLDDAALKAIAAGGGVVQTTAFDTYLKTPSAEKLAALDALRKQILGSETRMSGDMFRRFLAERKPIDEKFPGATVADYVDHIDYIVKLIGIDHVGISSDFDGGGGIIGWSDASEGLNVTLELVRRGYSEQEIAKLWGGNLLRVLDDVEQAAARLSAQASR